jgi:tetratricopeptide (TPR) repeat protein
MGCISFESGNYEKSFEYFNQSLEVFKSINDSYNTAILLAKIGDLYRLAGDQKTALNFYFQSLKYPKGLSLVWYPLVDLGDTYYSLEQYDSALYDQEKYMQTIKSLTVRSNYKTFPRILIAEKNCQCYCRKTGNNIIG